MPVLPFAAADMETGRDALTRQLLPASRHLQRFGHPGSPSTLGLEVLEEGAVTHYGGYDSGGAGWGSRIFERRHVEIEARKVPLASPGQPRFVLRDLRGSLMRTAFETGVIAASEDQLLAGNARTLAAPWCWFRPTIDWTEDVAGGGIVEVGYHVPKCSTRGLLIERFAENVLKTSFMQAALGGAWGASVNGNGTAVVDTTMTLVPTPSLIGSWAAQNYRITNDSTGSVLETAVSQTTTVTVTNGDIMMLDFDHHDPDAVAPYYLLFENGANKYFRASDSTWQAAVTWNQVPVSSAGIARYTFKVPFVANATSLNFKFGWPNSAAGSGARTHLLGAGLVRGRTSAKRTWARASRVYSGVAGANGRASSDLYIWNNDAGLRNWCATQGTFLARVITEWNSADVAGLGFFFELLRTYYDASNYISPFYDGDNSRWTFRRRQGGANTDLNVSAAVTAGVPNTIAFRWTSNANNELGDFYGTPTGSNGFFDAIVNGSRSGSQSVQPTESTLSNIYVGGTEGQQVDAFIKLELFPYVLSETECARRLAAMA